MYRYRVSIPFKGLARDVVSFIAFRILFTPRTGLIHFGNTKFTIEPARMTIHDVREFMIKYDIYSQIDNIHRKKLIVAIG